MITGEPHAPRRVRRDGVLASWETSARLAVPLIVLLVGVDDGSDEGRLPVVLTAAA